MSGAFDPWGALAKIRRERLGGLGADEVPAAAGEARFSARLGGLGGLGAERHAASDSDPAPVTEGGPEPPGALVWNDHEREALAAYYAEPPTPQPYRPSDPDPYTAGLRVAALMRPPSWSGSTPPPPRGAWCSCCGRSNPQAGGRWWQPRNPRNDGLAPGPGWRCWRCHPPPDPSEVEEVRT
jgi:hypothetical protein